MDTQLLKNAKVTDFRFEMQVKTCDDFDVRVIRSMTARIEIPELGVRMNPGPACEGFVTNVEGYSIGSAMLSELRYEMVMRPNRKTAMLVKKSKVSRLEKCR